MKGSQGRKDSTVGIYRNKEDRFCLDDDPNKKGDGGGIATGADGRAEIDDRPLGIVVSDDVDALCSSRMAISISKVECDTRCGLDFTLPPSEFSPCSHAEGPDKELELADTGSSSKTAEVITKRKGD